jgi:uncharacterized membrane protein YozB (DUF420 family)
MLPGFLPFAQNSTFMMDVVVCAMALISPLLVWSVRLAANRRFTTHMRVQTATGIVLGVAVALFEIEIRAVGGWRNLVERSPYLTTWLEPVLYVHLFFAITTFVLWAVTLPLALRRFARPPAPNGHSKSHRKLGYLTAGFTIMTSVTGWLFYYMAFVA